MSRPRRDPRADAARRTVAGGARPRSTIELAVASTVVVAGATVGTSGRPRRDPRAERSAVLVAADRPRLDRSLAAGGALHPAGTTTAGFGPPGAAPSGLGAGAEANRDATAGGAPLVAAAGSAASRGVTAPATAGSAAVATIRTIAAPACLVFVVPDAPGGRASAHDRQLLGSARLLADAAGGAVVVLAEGGAWGAAGADRVVSLAGEEPGSVDKTKTQPSPLAGEGREGGRPDLDVAFAAPPLPTLPREGGGVPNADVSKQGSVHSPSCPDTVSSSASYDPEARAAAVAAAIRTVTPRHVVFAETAEGGDLARRVAALLGERLFAGAESVTARTVTRPAKAGRVEQRTAPPRLVSLLPDIVATHAGPPHEARDVTLADLAAEAPGGTSAGETAEGGEAEGGEARAPIPLPPARGILSAETIPADPAKVPLAEASFVVSAGNGVTDFAGFHTLVAALGATPGASRVVCDAGLMARERQVGASGTVLDATCYFALGIAGAPQHLQGVAKCEHVVAVNTDLHAAMIERAGLAVVADAQKVMPALAALLAEERGGVSAATGPVGIPVGSDPAGDAAGESTLRPAERSGAETLDAMPPDPLRARILLSAGRHPVSGRPAPVRAEAQATALALAIGADVRGLHAGGDGAAVADHLGHGLGTIEVAASPADADPLPALVAALARQPADLVLMGRRGVGGDDSGQLPYRLAAALGLPMVADAVALAREPGRPDVLVVDQALPRGARRRVRVTLPAVVTIHPAAPSPRPFAFAAVRRGRLVPVEAGTAAAPPVALPAGAAPCLEERPWRRRPRLIAGTSTAGTAAERLKAATEVAGGGGRLLVDPTPAEAAREILAFLRGIGVVARPLT
jgi:electron transfer flavoprotein alpha subunit